MLPKFPYGALDALGIPGLVRTWRNAAPILCYHNVVSADHPAGVGDPSLHLPVDRFATQIRWLARQYAIVPLDELLQRFAERRPVRGLAAITFDDAYSGVFRHAWPILHARGLTATVFVVAGAAERPAPFWWDHPSIVAAGDAGREQWLGPARGEAAAILGDAAPAILPDDLMPAPWSMIAEAVREGLSVGAHSTTHRVLPAMGEREMAFEVAPCRSVIRLRTGATPRFFAYPYGRWDQRTADAVRHAGFDAALSLEPGLNHHETDRWALKRINVPASLPAATFEAWTAGIVPNLRRGA